MSKCALLNHKCKIWGQHMNVLAICAMAIGDVTPCPVTFTPYELGSLHKFILLNCSNCMVHTASHNHTYGSFIHHFRWVIDSLYAFVSSVFCTFPFLSLPSVLHSVTMYLHCENKGYIHWLPVPTSCLCTLIKRTYGKEHLILLRSQNC